MIALLLDSSNKNLSVGISKDGKVLAAIEYEAWQQQSELMVPEIKKALEANNLSIDDLKAIVVAIGPGSYTGVRIAVTIAKIMGFLLDIKVYKVSSLYVLKHTTNPTICLINARSNRSYIGVYHGENILIKDTIMTNDEVDSYIAEHQEFVIAGDTSYLNIKSINTNRFINMIEAIKEDHIVGDLLALKPVYLKD